MGEGPHDRGVQEEYAGVAVLADNPGVHAARMDAALPATASVNRNVSSAFPEPITETGRIRL